MNRVEAEREIMEHRAELMYKKRQLDRQHFRVLAFVLPARLNVPYEGEDADPNFKGTIFGRPIIWAETETWGVVS